MSKYTERLGRNAVKQAFDNLPTGICYFNQQGFPVLVNRKMDNLFYELTGKNLQYETEIIEAVEQLPEGIYTSKDEGIWQFTFNRERQLGVECIATDITSIYRENLELEEKNRQLQEMAVLMEEMGRNLVAIARDEEILSMKMRVHSNMGKCGLQIQKYYKEGCPKEEKKQLLAQLNQTMGLLQGEIGSPKENQMEDLLEAAESIGLHIQITGHIPEEETALKLLILALRECSTNAIRHAGASALFVKIEQDEFAYTVHIANNGSIPEEAITEGGGLSSLRKKLESTGGIMTVEAEPSFRLTVTIPKKGETV